jgi:c-di-GMP-binding flagellar brake protein YcgR
MVLLNPENSDEERTLDLNLCDVSLGGVGLVASDAVDSALVVGENYKHCKIFFPDIGTTDLTLKVRHITHLPTKDGLIKYHIGLQFIEPSRGNEGLINRYVFMLERQAIALANGSS